MDMYQATARNAMLNADIAITQKQLRNNIPSAANLKPETIAKIEETAKEFESVFISEMLKPMFQDINLDPMSDGSSSANEIYKSLMITEIGGSISTNGGIGLSDSIRTEMIKMQLGQ